jgi:hypothetical protein
MTDQLDRIEAKLDQLLAAKAPAPQASRFAVAPGAVAPASELDSQYGDPTVRKDPPKWTGDSFAGKPYSACSPEFLDNLAGFLEWKAGKDTEKGDADSLKYAGYARKDAARARGWAARNREKPAPSADLFGGPDVGGAFDDADIPF